MPLTNYSKFTMFTLWIWVFKSGVLRNLFILSKHGTKANIRSTKMANNRHEYNRDVLQSYWTSEWLPLYCSQPTGEKKTHKSTMWKICQDTADHGSHLIVTIGNRSVWLDGCHSQPVPYSKQHWLPNRRLSTRTVRNRLKSAGLKSKRVIKRPLLADRHRRSRFAWCTV